MNLNAESIELLPAVPGFPFLYQGAGAMIVGPTGGGRSSLTQAGLYDAARAGLGCAYLGHEVSYQEFSARFGNLARVRGDVVDDALMAQLYNVRYRPLAEAFDFAQRNTTKWVDEITSYFDIIAIDPLSAVASVLDLDFDTNNADFIRFYDQYIYPLITANVTVVMVDNVGHDSGAQRRAKGVSAKSDRCDLTFSCAKHSDGLLIRSNKVRSIRAGFKVSDQWLFTRDEQRILNYSSSGTDDNMFEPTEVMERAFRVINQTHGLTKTAIRSNISGKNETKLYAIECLRIGGYIEERRDKRTPTYYPLKPYPPAVSEGVPDTPSTVNRLSIVGDCGADL
jgi:hypothetical protein